MVIGRGEIWWADLPAPRGSEPGYRRPVLVIQADAFNGSRLNTIIAVAITSNMSLARAPGNLLLSPQKSGLPKPSVVNVSRIFTADKGVLHRKVRALSAKEMARVDEGLRCVLAL